MPKDTFINNQFLDFSFCDLIEAQIDPSTSKNTACVY